MSPSRAASLPTKVRAALSTDTTIDITTVGRQSGRPVRIEIWFMNVDDEIYITGTPGPRHWFANLIAEPTLTFHLKQSVVADLDAVARRVTEFNERRTVFTHPTTEWYRDQRSVDELVARSPLVHVRFEPAS